MESSESTMSPWLAGGLAAGVFSAAVNVACNAVVRKRSSARGGAARVHAGRHTALNVAITLEAFAHHCLATINRAGSAGPSQQEQVRLGDIELPPFAFPPDIQWRDLDAGKASYVRAFSANQAFSADLILQNERYANVAEFAANISGHCAEFGRRAWLMAVELREENELRAVEDHDCVLEFDAALSRYSAWKQRQHVRREKLATPFPSPSPASQTSQSSRGRGGAVVVGGAA
jgi:hypothetical protein